MAWSDPLGDLRLLLNDESTGNLVKSKRVFPPRGGVSDGQTSTFFTFEDRLVATAGPQNLSTSPLRVFLGSTASQQETEVAASGVVVLDAVRGEFALMGPAPSGVFMSASYYWQGWPDADLSSCLDQASRQVNATTAAQVIDGLQLAALEIAASLAHRRAAQRWTVRKSSQFLLEDAPSQEEITGMVNFHSQQAKEFMAEGIAARKAYNETRNDTASQPAFGLLRRTPRPYTPKR